MQQHFIPACYFPSTVLFVDDSRDFLLNFILHLDEGLAYRLFDSPCEALEFFHKKSCEVALLNCDRSIDSQGSGNCPLTDRSINRHLNRVHAEIYNPQRFSEVSVIVVDYAMSGMNGLEFCTRLENSSTKKILLVDDADEQRAIKALNEGVIHRYILKSASDVIDNITQSVAELQWQYFQVMSDIILRRFIISPPASLHDKKFVDFFQKLCREKNIVEYYLADHSGSFLLLDEDANISFLILNSLRDLRLHAELADKKGVDKVILSQLIQGEKIPVFWQGNSGDPQWQDWSSWLVPAQRLEADQTWFYAYSSGPLLFDVNPDKVLSYHQHLEELDAEALLV